MLVQRMLMVQYQYPEGYIRVATINYYIAIQHNLAPFLFASSFNRIIDRKHQQISCKEVAIILLYCCIQIKMNEITWLLILLEASSIIILLQLILVLLLLFNWVLLRCERRSYWLTCCCCSCFRIISPFLWNKSNSVWAK